MGNQSEQRSSWSGKLAFVLAAAASAVGLGSMWRFPYLTARYGGGTFLFFYLIFLFTMGLSLLILETTLGRRTRQSVIGSFSEFGKQYKFIGIITAAIPFIITPYYCVIGGWVTKYLAAYVTDTPHTLADGGDYFTAFITDPVASIICLLVFVLITIGVVALGVQKGIEKSNLVMMPLLIVVSAGIGIYTLTMPGAIDGLAFYLVPDFSKFSFELLLAAVGQVFYALSLAMGIMVTYGSYLKGSIKITNSSAQVTVTTLIVSLLAGLMIVPAAFVALGSGEAVAQNSGPSLMFIILPQVFENLGPAAPVLGVLFFLLVLFAALTSSISLLETMVSIFQDGANWSRRQSLTVCGVFLVVCSIIVCLGYSTFSGFQPMGEGSTILDLADFISNTIMMPIAALLTCVFVGWIIKPKTLIDEIQKNTPFKLAGPWSIMIKYIAPALMVVILVASIAKTLGIISF